MRIKARAGLRSLAVLAGSFLAMIVLPAAAHGPELAMLEGLQNGSWELRIRGADTRSRICLRTGHELVQIRHQRLNCSHFVVEDRPGAVTVQYTCSGNGYGRTTIRREGRQLVQIDSQGIENGLPFHFTAEARRVGGC